MAFTFENDLVQFSIRADGVTAQFIDRETGTDYAVPSPCAWIRTAEGMIAATEAVCRNDVLSVGFGDTAVRADLRVTAQGRYSIIEVLQVDGAGVEELVFVDLNLDPDADTVLAGCALALNLRTNVSDIPGANRRIRASCYPRFGLAGARAAVIGSPVSRMRAIMQEAVAAAPELPHSAVGGPWALDAPINRGSYLFNFRDLSEDRVDEWIRLAHSLGLNQIDFHGGQSFRFGDCRPNPETYPRGLVSMRAVTDRLHAAGIKAGLHTYAFFIDKSCPWVTPVPDDRLARDAVFSLATPLSVTEETVPVVESTQQMSAITGFFVRNSVTLQIGAELITYTGVSQTPPYAFTGCQRGVCGTQPTAHEPGTPVYHLKECFGLFVPEGESSLFGEVAACTAQAFNEGGFDMMYLDALDGEDVIGGGENGWHYGSKFVFEIWKHLERPALMEASTFHHHLWYVRSRIGAWDHPVRSHRAFIDAHCAANRSGRRMFLPAHLGWWAFKTWTGAQLEPTFPEDIEYLGAKCIGEDTGLSIMGVDPGTIDSIPAMTRLAAVLKRYEDLRHARVVPESIKERLRTPGAAFTLTGSVQSEWAFRPVDHHRHKVEALDAWSSTWTIRNRFADQPVRLRLEALLAAGAYDTLSAVTLAGAEAATALPERDTAPAVTLALEPVAVAESGRDVCLELTATNGAAERAGAWARAGRLHAPALDLSECQGLGFWLHGDGSGAVLNVQLRSPEHVSHAIGDHYVTLDFTGWRYIELIEPEGARYADYTWPYGNMYSIYRELVDYRQIERIDLWLNDVPAGGQTRCRLSPVRAVPVQSARLVHPVLTIDGRSTGFPVEMDSGTYLEIDPEGNGVLYGSQGERLQTVAPEGDVPRLKTGDNRIGFTCRTAGPSRPRAYVTVTAQGDPLSLEEDRSA